MALVTIACSVASICPSLALAETHGDFEVNGGTDGTDYAYENGILLIKSDTPLTIAMQNDATGATDDCIAVEAGDFVAELTLSGVAIDASPRSIPAIDIPAGASLKLILAQGTASQLHGARDQAAISVPVGATLEVGGEGELEATGGLYAAGIGGGTGTSTGKDSQTGKGGITITGGKVKATGGFGAAGIGGGPGGDGANITVTGGVVKAKSDGEGAGIGGGNVSVGKDIAISGGYISAQGADSADSIGSGKRGAARSRISVVGGYFADGTGIGINTVYGITPSEGYYAIANADPATSVDYPACVFSSGDFIVSGGAYGVDFSYEDNVLSVKSETPLAITMKEGVSTTTVDRIVVKDESANIALNGVSIDASSVGEAALSVSSDTLTLTLTGSNKLVSGASHAGLELGRLRSLVLNGGIDDSLSAEGGSNGAGIGSGSVDECGNITINGGTIKAQGGASAAGIGGAYYEASCGLITINDGRVTATGGGSTSWRASDVGAGIGSGARSTVHGVVITGGTVDATGGSVRTAYTNAGGAGIGTGYDGVMDNKTIGNGASILISGGEVIARGGVSAAGIGSGTTSNAVYGSISITGGSVDARAGAASDPQYGAAGIGCGYGAGSIGSGKPVVNSITISGGIVKATGTGSARAIGEAASNSVGSVSISGGSITAVGSLYEKTSITGGLFADTSASAVANNAVYGITVASGYEVYTNANPATSGSYPIGVAPVNDFTVTGGVYGMDYAYDNNVLSIKSSTSLSIAMRDGVKETFNDSLRVEAGVSANVTFDGVNVNPNTAAFDIKPTASAIITLKGENRLIGGPNRHCAGVQVPQGASVTIRGDGSLYASGAQYSAGIGGGDGIDAEAMANGSANASAGSITIESGTVEAFSWGAGAGIGGGYGGSAGTIAITGGKVKATGGSYGDIAAADIGAGASGSGGTVSIAGGLFAQAAVSGSVYGVVPVSTSTAVANLDENTKGAYPTLVLPTSQIEDPTIQLNASMAYAGATVATADVVKSAAYGPTDAKGSVVLQFAGGIAPAEAGKYKVSASLAAKQDGTLDAATAALAGIYYRAAAIGPADFTINPLPLTVTANPNVITYGDEPCAAGVAYSEFVAGESAANLGGALAYSFGYQRFQDAGQYAGAITPQGLTSSNYAITFESGALSVSSKEVGLTWSGTTNRIYGDGKAVTAVATGLVNGDEVGVEVSVDGQSAGTRIATATGLKGDNAKNYQLPDASSVTFDMAPRSGVEWKASITLPAATPNYEGALNLADVLPADFGGTATYALDSFTKTGLSAVAIEGSSLSLTCSGNAAATDTDTVVVRVGGDGNYADCEVAVTVTYSAKPVASISSVSAMTDLVYTGEMQNGYSGVPEAVYEGGSYAGPFVESYVGTGATSYGPSSVAPTVAGDYAVTISVPAETAACAGSVTLNFSIAKAPLTVTAKDAVATYGQDVQLAGASYGGFVNGENESVLEGALQLACGYAKGDPVGTYAVTPSGQVAANYSIDFAPGSLVVSPLALTATVDTASSSATRAYNATTAFSDVALVLAGVLPGNDVSAVATGQTADAKAGMGKALSVSDVKLSGKDAANYSLDSKATTGSVSVTKATLVVTASSATIMAGDALPEFACAVGGLAEGDKVLAAAICKVNGDYSKSGIYTVEAFGIQVTNQDCYDVKYAPGTLAVKAAPSGGNSDDGSGNGDNAGDDGGSNAKPLAGTGALLAATGDSLIGPAALLGAFACAAVAIALATRRRTR